MSGAPEDLRGAAEACARELWEESVGISQADIVAILTKHGAFASSSQGASPSAPLDKRVICPCCDGQGWQPDDPEWTERGSPSAPAAEPRTDDEIAYSLGINVHVVAEAWRTLRQWREHEVARLHATTESSTWREADEATPDPAAILRDALARTLTALSAPVGQPGETKPWTGTFNNWIAPFSACPRCGRSLNWKQAVDVLDRDHIAADCCGVHHGALLRAPVGREET